MQSFDALRSKSREHSRYHCFLNLARPGDLGFLGFGFLAFFWGMTTWSEFLAHPASMYVTEDVLERYNMGRKFTKCTYLTS